RFFEIARIAGKDQPLPWLIGADDERPEPDHLGDWRLQPPRLAQRTRLQRAFELVARQDRQRVEDTDAWRERRGERDRDSVIARLLYFQDLPPSRDCVAEHAAVLRVVRSVEGEDDILRRERDAVGEGQTLTQLHVVAGAVGGGGPRIGKHQILTP